MDTAALFALATARADSGLAAALSVDDIVSRKVAGEGWCKWYGSPSHWPDRELPIRACKADAPGAIPVPCSPARELVGIAPTQVYWVQVSEPDGGHCDSVTFELWPVTVDRAAELLALYGV